MRGKWLNQDGNVILNLEGILVGQASEMAGALQKLIHLSCNYAEDFVFQLNQTWYQ